ncbi:hypothetical protein CLAIMM_11241 [Cladophialophora immunda]|nr:hypothetical protein CLAIMM_11241 [Cladophialophora immunda]
MRATRQPASYLEHLPRSSQPSLIRPPAQLQFSPTSTGLAVPFVQKLGEHERSARGTRLVGVRTNCFEKHLMTWFEWSIDTDCGCGIAYGIRRGTSIGSPSSLGIQSRPASQVSYEYVLCGGGCN